MKELLKPADLAPMLGVTTARVYQMLDEKMLPCIHVGRGVFIPRAAWDQWLSQQTERAMASVRPATSKGTEA